MAVKVMLMKGVPKSGSQASRSRSKVGTDIRSSRHPMNPGARRKIMYQLTAPTAASSGWKLEVGIKSRGTIHPSSSVRFKMKSYMQMLNANAGVEPCPSHKSRWRASGCCSAELNIIKQVTRKGARTPIVPESLRLWGTTCQLEGVAHGTSTG